MVEILNWVGLSLFLAGLALHLGVRFKHPPDDNRSRRVSNAGVLIALAGIIGVLPHIAGASEAIRVASSLVSMVLSGVAVSLLLYHRRARSRHSS